MKVHNYKIKNNIEQAEDTTCGTCRKITLNGIGIGAGYLFKTTFQREATSDLTGERGSLMGAIEGNKHLVNGVETYYFTYINYFWIGAALMSVLMTCIVWKAKPKTV